MPSNAKNRDDRIRNEAHHWWSVIVDSETKDDDIADFEDWYRASPDHATAYERARRNYLSSSAFKASDFPTHFSQPTIKERLLNPYMRVERQQSGNHWLPLPVLSVATAMIVIAVVVIFKSLEPGEPIAGDAYAESYKTVVGVIETFSLPDGSSVTLGPNSELEVAFETGARSTRLLAGTAFFDVFSDSARPFSVSLGNLTARVVGTQFDARITPVGNRIAVAEGQVRVSVPLEIDGGSAGFLSSHTLTPGQAVVSSEAGLSKPRTIEVQDVGAWKDRRLVYVDTSLKEIVADVNRYDTREITLAASSADIGKLRLSGTFTVENADGVLATLKEVFAVEAVEVEVGRIELRRASQSPDNH